ncbi:DEAD/DEAH box helicase [Pseudoramibacter sp.]|jgi:type III restriction enzyme|uniref:DEAD/DEAH box helicase n=1 Tax=Pseudoramibacter sp. TaxID=2034862 RepID=UPI0025D69916|nr:DEAD/DEAH box helicase family protein [Pseudoramibacter sp.]MCH4071819.1 DEAD/DEAH box helicase family protein [Pseudoramibacter sp.]MCH4105587.1 DEAD/DEAH box helicase family protein [Pseudoramibacter sp.]
MKVELFPFQKKALNDLRIQTAEAMGSYYRTHAPQVVSFTAPTGAGKTIIMAALIEDIYYGDERFADQQDAIFVWLSDSPQLNEQSKLKIDGKADKISLAQCVTVTEDSFDRETFEDGHIYFLNTQKLSVSSNLTKHGDSRTYTIWETIANTVREKSDRLYFIIDEAHRGMQGRKASRATTIMQKFIKGSEEDELPSMPVVIGMSATTQRFNKLVEKSASTIHKVVVTTEDVRASGLLKDRIIITYPEETKNKNDMAILQAAVDDWKEKWGHWTQYCQEQHYAYVNPILIIQVQNGKGKKLSDTDLDDCLAKIEERANVQFEPGQVVHTFGQLESDIEMNGLKVHYAEPSRIAEDKNIRVVFFKENLSTGWDCPRAETMMSFRHAKDATYIAQLLGRMIRTPMQMHIQVDDVLNDVHLFLPYFNEQTVKDVVEELQNSEGGDIPTDIYGEPISGKKFDTLTVRKSNKDKYHIGPEQVKMDDDLNDREKGSSVAEERHEFKIKNPPDQGMSKNESEDEYYPKQTSSTVEHNENNQESNRKIQDEETIPKSGKVQEHKVQHEFAETFDPKVDDIFDREGVMKYINDEGLLSYDVRSFQITDYLKSLFKLAHFLTMTNLRKQAIVEVYDEIADLIHDHIATLKAQNEYENLVLQVKQFKLATQIFDAFGESVDNYSVHNMFTTTDSDLERQFRVADHKLGNEGIGLTYGKKYGSLDDPAAFEIDVILFVADKECMNHLYEYAKKKFHALNDEYRRYVATINSDKYRRQYDNIVSDGDKISKHNFRLPETIQVPHDNGGKEYRDHLFVNEVTGTAKLKLNNWESGVIAEEEKRPDFVCWIRNPSRGSWALCIPYEKDGEMKPTYPDFIIVRRDEVTDYVVDILEPHNPEYNDNLGKAKGFAEYARQNPGVGRIQLIREGKDASGKKHFKRLDMAKSSIREKVLKMTSSEELDHLFDIEGFYDD